MDVTLPKNELTFENIMLMFQEIAQRFKETDKKFQDTDKKFQDTDKKFQDTDKKFQDTDRKFQDTDKLLTDKFHDTDKQFKNTSKEVSRLANLFTTQWGKLIEALVEPSCVRLFQERGIDIEQTMTNVKAKHKGRDTMECDILLVNDTELVVVEVKTTFRPDYVDELTEKLRVFKEYFSQYKNYNVYGATAALRYDGQSDKYAYRNGFFVLKSSGDVISIANDEMFKPTAF